MKTLLEHVLKDCLIFTVTIYRLKSMQKIILHVLELENHNTDRITGLHLTAGIHLTHTFACSSLPKTSPVIVSPLTSSYFPSCVPAPSLTGSSKLVALVCNPVRLGHLKKKNLSISPSAGLMSQKKKHCLQITSSSTTPCKLLFFLVTIFLPHVNLKLVQTHLCSSLYGELTIHFF